MERHVRILNSANEPVSGATVALERSGQREEAVTDGRGEATIFFEQDWADALLVNDVPVKKDIDLSGGFGGAKRDLGTFHTGTGDSSGGLRRLKLEYPDGEPVSRAAVTLTKGGDSTDTETDEFGVCQFAWPHEFCDRLEVEQITVRRDWDMSGGFFSSAKADLGTVKIPRPGDDNPYEQNLDRDEEQGVRGLLFYSDGTLAFEAFRLEVEFADQFGENDGKRYSSEDKGSYCRDNGHFFIRTEKYRPGTRIHKAYVNGDEIPRNMLWRTRDGENVIVMPKAYGRSGGGQRGGLVTGVVVDHNGSPAHNAKISAEVGGFLSNDVFTVHADKKGRFVLPFEGAPRIKKFYVDGSAPKEIRAGKGKAAREVRDRDIPAGTFGMRVVRNKKMFGIF